MKQITTEGQLFTTSGTHPIVVNIPNRGDWTIQLVAAMQVGPAWHRARSMKSFLRRWARDGAMTAFLMSKTIAKLRIMAASEPPMPAVAIRRSLASMSHRPAPFHQWKTSSVGHISGLIRLQVFNIATQAIRDTAGILRFLECHTRGPIVTTRANADSMGRTVDVAGLLNTRDIILNLVYVHGVVAIVLCSLDPDGSCSLTSVTYSSLARSTSLGFRKLLKEVSRML